MFLFHSCEPVRHSCVRADERVTHILRGQIRTLSHPSNSDLHSYWNWHPKSSTCDDDDQTEVVSGNITVDHISIDTKANIDYGEIVNSIGNFKPNSNMNPTRRENLCTILPTTVDNTLQEVELSVIIADLHANFINHCHTHFMEMNFFVELKQAPIQEEILTALHEDSSNCNIETYILFGSYGNGMINSALQKQLNECFPEQMNNLRDKAQSVGRGKGCEDEMDINMINQGEIFIAEPSLVNLTGSKTHFVSCAAYPRKQRPTEQEHIKDMFHRAVDLVISHHKANLNCPNSSEVPRRINKLRIVTHAMGSFVGHDNVEVFAWGLAQGLNASILTLT